jgi:hypothetical protein
VEALPLSREATAGRRGIGLRDPDVTNRLTELLRDHLDSSPFAGGDDGWRYKQRLMSYFKAGPSFWIDEPATVLAVIDGERTLATLRQATEWPTLTVVVNPRRRARDDVVEGDPDAGSHRLAESAVNVLSEYARVLLFEPRRLSAFRPLPNGLLAFDWTLGDDSVPRLGTQSQVADVVDLQDDEPIAMRIHRAANSTYDHVLLNARHPLVQWLLRVQEACKSNVAGLNQQTWRVLMDLLASPSWYFGLHVEELSHYLNNWNDLSGLPPELHVPDLKLTERDFTSPGGREAFLEDVLQ